MFAKYTRSFKCDFSERASVNALSAKKTARCFNLNYDMNSVAASHRLDIAELEGAIRAPLNDSLDGLKGPPKRILHTILPVARNCLTDVEAGECNRRHKCRSHHTSMFRMAVQRRQKPPDAACLRDWDTACLCNEDLVVGVYCEITDYAAPNMPVESPRNVAHGCPAPPEAAGCHLPVR